MSNNKCIYHLHLGPFPLYYINNQNDFKGGGGQRIMLHDKTLFSTLTHLLKNGSRAPDLNTSAQILYTVIIE